MDFRARLINGETLLGTMITLPSPEMVEIMIDVGYDWLFVDCEHGAFDTATAQSLLQAAGNRCPCVIRVPNSDDVWIKKALDIGASGIIVPQVNSASQARSVVASCKYPPEGTRGVGIGRAHGYGANFNDYVACANDQIAVIVQAEHIDAVNRIDEIVEVKGIDAVLIGPYDLSASLGKIGKLDDPELAVAIEKVRSCCAAAGIKLGFFGVSAEAVKPFLAQGYTLVAVGVDVLFASKSAAETLQSLQYS